MTTAGRKTPPGPARAAGKDGSIRVEDCSGPAHHETTPGARISLGRNNIGRGENNRLIQCAIDLNTASVRDVDERVEFDDRPGADRQRQTRRNGEIVGE